MGAPAPQGRRRSRRYPVGAVHQDVGIDQDRCHRPIRSSYSDSRLQPRPAGAWRRRLASDRMNEMALRRAAGSPRLSPTSARSSASRMISAPVTPRCLARCLTRGGGVACLILIFSVLWMGFIPSPMAFIPSRMAFIPCGIGFIPSPMALIRSRIGLIPCGMGFIPSRMA